MLIKIGDIILRYKTILSDMIKIDK